MVYNICIECYSYSQFTKVIKECQQKGLKLHGEYYFVESIIGECDESLIGALKEIKGVQSITKNGLIT